ncbi:IS1/IS1595 family N-terminal zinc-binding domain-containing protein [Roseivirga misakiensis]|uniref:Transposase n=1 Tax=Roseivirga misakiensis TaxID=1563681 RepID=A0A1E5T744_9BACT|nr:helix-turn-helix domain-containing protein [Roseivirga misakiensis]OEK07168.1 transposase [Roseivirga misakiensis]
MKYPICPRCKSENASKSGVINGRQRFKCKQCSYYFTVAKLGKQIDSYLVVKALQLYIEGVSYREIERILGVSHVSVMNWVKKYNVKPPLSADYRPTYKVLNHNELNNMVTSPDFLKGAGMILTELGDKYMMIKWERFRE